MEKKYKVVAKGSFCTVLMTVKDIKAFNKLDKHEKGRANKVIGQLSDSGTENLNSQHHFKPEGRYSSGIVGQAKIPVYAIKGDQLRIYGGFVNIDGKEFFCIETDMKKQNKADRKQLERVAKKLGEINARN